MRIVSETEQLKKLLMLFSDLTEITITLFDDNMKMITDANFGHYKNYCCLIGDNTERLKKCKQCDAHYALQAKEQKAMVMYSCHAGIAEVIKPLYLPALQTGPDPSAYLLIGKFRDAGERYSSAQLIEEKAESFNLDKNVMLKYWEELPLIDDEKMANVIGLLNLVATTIINGKLIHAPKTAWTENITDYILKNLHKNITAEDLCHVSNMSRYDLYVHFKQYFNMTPKEYINQLRLHKAQTLLQKTDLSVMEIGIAIGFKKIDDFTKFFRVKMGMGITPLQYRKQKRLQTD